MDVYSDLHDEYPQNFQSKKCFEARHPLNTILMNLEISYLSEQRFKITADNNITWKM